MAYKADGTWSEEDSSVASRVAALQSQDSALMRGAIASGTKAANRRGLTNSTLGVGAGVAAGLGAVTPIASQDAQTAHQRNVVAMEDKRARDISKDSIAAQDRASYMQGITQLGSNYSQGISNTLQNDKIPAATRSQVQGDLSNIYKAQQQQLSSLYGISLNWS